jgi:hypothetical protein
MRDISIADGDLTTARRRGGRYFEDCNLTTVADNSLAPAHYPSRPLAGS